MKRTRLLFTSLFALLLSGCNANFTHQLEQEEPDNATYGQRLVADFNQPDIQYKSVTRAKVSASSVKIHYHNDDKLCGSREFWVWCDGVNGSAFAPQTISSDKKDMTLSITFTGDYEHFAGKKGIYFIVKFKGNWENQSDNMYVDYSEFTPDGSGMSEVWCIPGEGNAVEMYKTEAETKMDRFQLASFKDWKTISVIATAVPQTYRLYALTANYMKISSVATQEDLDKYLIAQGSTPTCTDVEYNSLPCKQFDIKLNYTAKVNVQYYIEGVFPQYKSYTKTKYVSFHSLYETPRFKQYYEYIGTDLGATYESKTSTTFKVWAPTAARVRLLLYKSGIPESLTEDYDVPGGDDSYSGYDMAFQPGGIWQITIKNRDLHGVYYNYYVVNSNGKVTATDPYAKACSVNGVRSMVCDFSLTNPEGWDSIPLVWNNQPGFDIAHPNDLSIYETHIRDLTMDETWNGSEMRGTYSAFIESGTTYEKNGYKVTTGYDHLIEMGVKAIQLEPVFDSDNLEQIGARSYNWGYNPLNYNCVDGSYATNPYQGSARIKEYKQLIQKFASNTDEAGAKQPVRIVMDVVYNHVASAPSSCFNKIMPKYYFRYRADGSYHDGTGCGNEVKTEAPMMSKYIVESLCWWAKEYKIKGFRFDLMGNIDYMTIKEAAKALYKIDPDIYLYGEGWSGYGGCNMDNGEGGQYYGNWGANTWTVYNKLYKDGEMCYVGGFNDTARDAMRGDNNWFEDGKNNDSFLSTKNTGDRAEAVANMLVGVHKGVGSSPNQCVNYNSCHDNFTLFDQLTNSVGADGNNGYYPGVVCAASVAANCAVMFSNGVAFMQGGEELFRSKVVTNAEDLELGAGDIVTVAGKKVSHNSYNLSDDVNAFKWDRKIYVGDTFVLDYVQELEKAIELRNTTLEKYSEEDLDFVWVQNGYNDDGSEKWEPRTPTKNPFSSQCQINVWNYGNNSTCIGMKNNNHFFFLAGCCDEAISFGAYDGLDSGGVKFNKQVFCSNPKDGGFTHPQTGYIKLGWDTCVCLTKNS